MRIDTDPKLDFKDVLIRPKRSTLASRSQVRTRRNFARLRRTGATHTPDARVHPDQVDVSRTYSFCNSEQEWTGVPIMAANMDSVGTFEVACALVEYGMVTCMTKHYTLDEWLAFADEHPEALPYVAASAVRPPRPLLLALAPALARPPGPAPLAPRGAERLSAQGSSQEDFEMLTAILTAIPEVSMICLDVANGYSQAFIDTVRPLSSPPRRPSAPSTPELSRFRFCATGSGGQASVPEALDRRWERGDGGDGRGAYTLRR